MAVTTPGPRAADLSSPGRTRSGTALPIRQRRPGYAAVAVVLIVGLATLGAYLYSTAGRKTPVVVVVRPVSAGHQIARGDLSTVDVAGEVTAVAGSRIDTVVGGYASVPLLPNMLLQRSMVTDTNPLPSGSAMVGVALKPGQLPATGIDIGAHVQVLELGNRNSPVAASASPTATVLVGAATVYASAPDPSQTGGVLITLLVPRADAAQVAAAASVGAVALVQVAP